MYHYYVFSLRYQSRVSRDFFVWRNFMDELKNTIRNNWNKNAHMYDSQFQHGLHSSEEKEAWLDLLSVLVQGEDKKILDVGAGTGFLSLLLAELGHTVKAVDLSEGMLNKAKLKAEEMGFLDKISFAQGDAENLDEPDEFYDVVINRHLLWAMPNPDQAISEWKRVLKPGGKLIIIDGDWHYNLPSNNAKIFFGKALTLVTEGKNMFKKYKSETAGKLPMTIPKNAKAAPERVKSLGFEVTVLRTKDIEEAEKKVMPLKARLLNPYHRIIIIGKKTELSAQG